MVIHLSQPDILLGPLGVVTTDRIVSVRSLSSTARAILEVLAENRDVNAYFIRKRLKGPDGKPSHYSTVYKAINEQIVDCAFKLVEVSKRQSKKNKKQAIEIYCLTHIGISALVNIFYDGRENISEEVLKRLGKLFGNIKTNYPSFLPKPLQDMPDTYSVSFYPFFGDLSVPFVKLMEAKLKNPQKGQFTIDNGCFISAVRLEKKETDLIVNHLNHFLEEQKIAMSEENREKKRKLKQLRKQLEEFSQL